MLCCILAGVIKLHLPEPEWRKHRRAGSQAYGRGDKTLWEQQELLALQKCPEHEGAASYIAYQLASEYQSQGRTDEAEAYFKKSLELSKRACGDSSDRAAERRWPPEP